MKVLVDRLNNNTQPRTEFKVFNRWDIVTKGWYTALDSKMLKRESARAVLVAGQHLVFYRGASGKVYALDGFCPHMGVDLGIGKVKGENLSCFFHHWKFDGEGQCIDIPCLKNQAKKISTAHYSVQEKYGKIWVYPASSSPYDVLEIPELSGEELFFSSGSRYKRNCHFHITMINGIDPQHLATVHGIEMDMSVEIDQSERDSIDIELKGNTPSKKIIEKLIKFFLGNTYSYSMKYQGGCLASLSVMKNVKLFGRFSVIPTLHMIFSYHANTEGETVVQPIYVTKKRNFLIDRMLILFTKMAFFSLQGEDGQVYDNIRFNTSNLLPIDAPVAKYIQYINSLSPSVWSRTNFDSKNKAASSHMESRF